MWYENITNPTLREFCVRYCNGTVTLEEVVTVMLEADVFGDKTRGSWDDAYVILAHLVGHYGTVDA